MPRVFWPRVFGNRRTSGLTTPVLAVADNADGTGGVATITGSDSGSTNTVSVQLYGASTWASAGSRTGNGTVALALASGYYFVKVDSGLGWQSVISNIVSLAVTDAADSVHGRSADAIRARLLTLSMPLLKGVHRQMLPDENTTTCPFVSVHFNEGEQYTGTGTNIRDDVGYPVHVLLCDRKLTSVATMPDWILSYRQRMQRALRHQHLAGVPESMDVLIIPSVVVDMKTLEYNFFVSGFTAVCMSREVRGV